MSLLQETARRIAGQMGRDSLLVRALRPAYESVLNCASLGRGIPWTINGITFRIDAHHRCRMGQEYDSTVAALLQKRIKPGSVCLDVGANVGVYALQFAHWSAANGRVIAFEPNPATQRELRKHIRMNGLTERVEVVAAAIGAASGNAVFFAANVDGMSRLGEANPAVASQSSPIQVSVTTLDEFCTARQLQPNVLLIDVEGFEFAALDGARDLIKNRGNELTIVVEMHPFAWPSAGMSRHLAASLLDELGLQPIPLMGQLDPLNEYGSVLLSHG